MIIQKQQKPLEDCFQFLHSFFLGNIGTGNKYLLNRKRNKHVLKKHKNELFIKRIFEKIQYKLNYLGGGKKGLSELNYCSRKNTLQFTFIKNEDTGAFL